MISEPGLAPQEIVEKKVLTPSRPIPMTATASTSVSPFTVAMGRFAEPKQVILPRLKPSPLQHHRYSTNPGFVMGLLQDIAIVVGGWQGQLEQIHSQIQALYLEGPIVEGWLETRFATGYDNLPSYLLCGLDQSGAPWSRVCPPEQLPEVSLAIARYQKLRQYLNQKEAMESHLQQLGETLAVLRSSL
jgi:hypothetical protein